jgi:hypothetical protein
MRNISQLALSLILLATQANITFSSNATAADDQSPTAVGVREVKLNTNTSQFVELVGPKKPDYEKEVLAPIRVAQAAAAEKARLAAEAAAKAAAAKAAATKAAAVKVARATVPAVVVIGSHTDWMLAAGIAESDFGYVNYIIDHESGWGVTKANYGGSGAYGLGQALPASKMAAFGSDYLTNPVTQLRWANAYAVGRYGSWASAYSHWIARHSW